MSRVERRLRRRRRRRGVLVMGALLAVVGMVVFQALQWSAAREKKAIPPGQEVTITVSSGQSSVEIGRALREAGVVDSVNRFRDVAEERGLDSLLKPGEYKLVTGMSIDAVLEILAKGPSTGIPLTIPEGYTVAQIVDKLAATDQFTKAEVTKALKSKDLIVPLRPKGVTSLEGLLFPDTYGIEEDDTAVGVIQDMAEQLEVVLSRYQLSTAPQGLNAYQLLIVASMIEREAKVDADRPKIAAVIYNRLAAGKRLEIDATVEYAVGHAKLTAKDLQSHLAVQHLHQRRPAADPDRRPRRGRDQGRPPAGRRRLDLLRARQQGRRARLHQQLPGVPAPQGRGQGQGPALAVPVAAVRARGLVAGRGVVVAVPVAAESVCREADGGPGRCGPGG